MPKLRSILPALALAATLYAPAHAQLTPLQDPANLAGERVSPQDPADTLPLNHGAPALQQLLAKLRTRASLMLIVAHPDDEDGGLLTYESRGQGARVAMLTLTRGEGGQNLMSADFDDALGLIRTQELLAADRYFGVDQFFGTEVDFGFSKTKEETFSKWTHDRVLYDAVRAVRLYRPLVIASVFVGGPTDGHGQHQVAGEIAQEVFLAAADPKVFPEMGLPVWAPLKVYARVPFSRVTPEGMYDYATGKTIPTRFHNYVTGEDTTAVPTATVLIHEGDKPSDPILAAAMGGDTFLQFARKGLALQKTQIGPNARLAPAGAFDAPYTLIASRVGCIDTKAGCPTFATASSSLRWASTKPTTEQSLFDGIDTSLPGLATLAPNGPKLREFFTAIDRRIAEAQKLFTPDHPEITVPPLRAALNATDILILAYEKSRDIPEEQRVNLLHELRLKHVQLNNALVLAHSITLEAQLTNKFHETSAFLLADSSAYVLEKLTGSHAEELKFLSSGVSTLYEAPTTLLDKRNAPGIGSPLTPNTTAQFTFLVPGGPITRPYFQRLSIEQPFYNISDSSLRNAPATPAPLIAWTTFVDDGVPLRVESAVKQNENSHTQAAVSIPWVSVSISPSIGIIPLQEHSFVVATHVRSPAQGRGNTIVLSTDAPSTSDSTEGGIELVAPSAWGVKPQSARWKVSNAVEERDINFTLVPSMLLANTHYKVAASASWGAEQPNEKMRFTEAFRPVGYPGLPYTNFYTPATYRVTAIDLHTAPNLRIAYLPGTGDPVPDFLPNLGITPTLLTFKDLTPATLNQYDAVLLGVRAYAAHPELTGPGSQPLLDYAKQGGVVILQYNTARFGDAEAPFPIDVPGDSAHNVVEEAQPVTLLRPEAPLLTWPNKITSADFDGWVAERGHGFAATWSPSYTPLLETHDVGQDPQQGGLLLARTGKGAYIYCALALYRQLPEGVPGAYRLLANLLSLAKNPGFQAH